MEVDDSGCLVAIASASSSNTFIERSKFQITVQLESQGVELHLVDLSARVGKAHLEGDSVAESVSMGTAETEVNVVDFTIGDTVVVYLERHFDLELLLASDSESDWHVDHLDREHGGFFLALLGVIHAEEDTSFPRPVSAVLDPYLLEDSLTGSNIVYLLCGLGPANGTLLLPLATATTPLVLAVALAEHLGELVVGELEAVFFKLLLDLFSLNALGIHESFEHVLPLLGTSHASHAWSLELGASTTSLGLFRLLLVFLLFVV